MSTVLSKGLLNVTLRSPDFSNVQKITLAKINQKTRGGDIIIYRDPIWPTSRVLSYTFTNLTQRQAKALLDFVELTIGQVITLTDFELTVWQGVIITPAAQIVQPGIDVFSASFDFQGDRI